MLCQAGGAAALGMGDLSVRSQLGQPLRATVNLVDAPADAAADCFSLTTGADSLSPRLRAQLSIERIGGQTRLHIRTSFPINDPVLQFVLVSDCQVRLQREYVILLDPPPAVTPAIIEADGAPAPAASSPAPGAVPPQAVPARRHAVHHATKRHAPRVARTTASRSGESRPRHAAAKAQPRLILSGKQAAGALGDTPMALRLDTALPDLNRPHPDKLSATELSDENTALAHKLADLEAQLADLRRRNRELEAARRATAPAARPVATAPAPAPEAQWPFYLLGTGGVAGLIGIGAWLLRRNRSGSSRVEPDTLWTQPATTEKTLAELSATLPKEPPPAAERMPEIAAPPPDEGTEVKEDILDQAEVFMAHGHGELAIHLLQEHLRAAPTESPVPWLLLLDLLHREGDAAGYAAASAECRRYFNVNLTDHPISQDSEGGKGLEAYPHLLEQLVKAWNTPEIDGFFHDLIYDNRGGTRMGFEPGAYRDILMLRGIANANQKLAA